MIVEVAVDLDVVAEGSCGSVRNREDSEKCVGR